MLCVTIMVVVIAERGGRHRRSVFHDLFRGGKDSSAAVMLVEARRILVGPIRCHDQRQGPAGWPPESRANAILQPDSSPGRDRAIASRSRASFRIAGTDGKGRSGAGDVPATQRDRPCFSIDRHLFADCRPRGVLE